MKREAGIDLLRLLSMFMVVLLHVLGHGGILSHALEGSLNYQVAWLLEIAAYGAADVFAMITGYLMVKSHYKVKRVLEIWFQTFFYSFGISLVFFIFAPLIIGKTGLVLSLFPLLTNTYWYITAYIGFFFFIPLLSFGVSKLTKTQALSALALGFILFTVLPMLAGVDLFSLSSGYSSFWLILMALTGALIGQFDLFGTGSKSFAWALYGVNVMIVFVKIMVVDVVIAQTLGEPKWTLTFLSYTSPFVFLSALGLFLAILKIRFQSPKVIGFLKVLSPLALGVYLFSEHPLIWKTFLAEHLVFLVNEPLYWLIPAIFGITAVIFVLSLGIDALRRALFKVLRIDVLIEAVSHSLETRFTKLIQRGEA